MPKTIHPTNRTLLAYLDGELPVDHRHEVAAHLRACPDCRGELDGIEADLDWHLVLDAASLPSQAPPRAEGLQRLLRAAREWRQSDAGIAVMAASQSRHEQDRASQQMEAYLGADVADEVARTDRAELLFSAFLGRRAASALMKDIRLHVKMERGLAPDLS